MVKYMMLVYQKMRFYLVLNNKLEFLKNIGYSWTFTNTNCEKMSRANFRS